MRRKWGVVFTLAVLGGAALHFLYDVWPNPLTAVLAPVNESVWEHLKLLYWPFLAAAFVLARGADDARGRWCGLLVGLLAARSTRALPQRCPAVSARRGSVFSPHLGRTHRVRLLFCPRRSASGTFFCPFFGTLPVGE